MAASTAAAEKTPAQIMQEQHEAAETHHPYVEDAVDIDDLEHPPPPLPAAAPTQEKTPATNGLSNGVMSAKAAGKQKAHGISTSIDVQSEDAFPTLGGAPKPQSAPTPGKWSNRPLSSAAVNGATPHTSRPSSGVATPVTSPGAARTSTLATGGAVRPQEFGQAPVFGMLPGRHTDGLNIPTTSIDRTKPIRNTVLHVQKKTNTNIKTEEHDGFLRCIVEGRSKDVVRRACAMLSETLTIEETATLEIPASLKSHVIGSKGANVREMESKFKVKVQMQNDKDSFGAKTAINSNETATIRITGHHANVEGAKTAISQLVRDKQPSVDLQLEGVPPHLFPLIARNHAARLQQWQREGEVQVQIPQTPSQPATRQWDSPATILGPYITVSGDHASATQAHAELSGFAKQLQEQLKSRQHPVPRSLHPYIVGERGMSPDEFLQDTGCVVLLPSTGSGSDEIVIVGPEDRLHAAQARAAELAAKVSHRPFHVHESFVTAPQEPAVHARALARYLQHKRIEQEMQDMHSAEVVFPVSGGSATTWNLFAPEIANAGQAHTDLERIVQAYPPERMRSVPMDPFFYPHLSGPFAEELADEFAVHLILPDDSDDEVVLIYEGEPSAGNSRISRQRPTAHQLRSFNLFLQGAQDQLSRNLGEQSVNVQSIEVPRKYRDKVRKHVSGIPESEPRERFPVQIDYGYGSGSSKSRRIKPDNVSTTDETVVLRGLDESRLDFLREEIRQALTQAIEDETTRSYTTTLDFPDSLKNQLIGKQGSKIKELQNLYDVDISTKEPEKIRIQGPQRSAEECKAKVAQLSKQWADEVIFRVTIDPSLLGQLIGKGGENITRLKDDSEGLVSIQMPPKSRSEESQPMADNASDAGSHRIARANQAPNEIVIRGPRKKAEEVRTQITELYKLYKEKSFEDSISVDARQIPSIVGRGGLEIDKLRIETGADIKLPPNNDKSGRVTIALRGSKQEVEKAKMLLQQKSKAFDAVVSDTITVDRKYHQNLIGASGSNISRIVKEAGGVSADAVQFPKKGSTSDQVTVSGDRSVVEKIVAALKSYVAERENEVTESLDVSTDRHHVLIGRGGESRRALEEKFKVKLDVPRQNTGTTVKITGEPSSVAEAKEEILRRTAKPKGEAVDVPRSLHHAIGNNGQLFRELRGKKVVVDHGGQQPPERPTAAAPKTSRSANGALPLIIDEQSDASVHSWDIVETAAAGNGESGTIPWILSGPPEAVAAAKAQISELLSSASEPKVTGYLVLSDPRLHRHIIGRGGSKINEIRKRTGSNIQVPKASGPTDGEAIKIVGSKEGCEEAYTLIMEAVEHGEAGGRPSSSRS